jgi:hypothetical protein
MLLIQGIFTNDSWEQYLAREDTTFLPSRVRRNLRTGSIIYFFNKDTQELVGLGEVSTWEDGSVCRECHLHEISPYTEELSKICMKNVRILRNPVSGENIAKLLSIYSKVSNNITKCGHAYSRAYYGKKDERDESVIERFRIFLLSLF